MAKTATKTKPDHLPAKRAGSSDVAVPSFMEEDRGRGAENIGRDDIATPRIKLMQSLSKELDAYDSLGQGDYFHTAAEHVFKKGTPFRAVVVFYHKTYILWNPLENGGGILARADDAVHWSPSQGQFKVSLDKKDGGNEVTWRLAPTVVQSGLANWGTMNPDDNQSPPAATLMLNYVLAFPDIPDLAPAVLTFQRSSVGIGKKFNGKLKIGSAPVFGRVYEFQSFKDKNRSGQEFWNTNVNAAGLLTEKDKELYLLYRDVNKSFTEAGLIIRDVDTLQDEDPVDEADDESEDKGSGKRDSQGRPRI